MVSINTKLGHCYKICPYGEQSESHNDFRIPLIEKTNHTNTEGKMIITSRGWICTDDECSFFLGTATTPIIQIRFRCSTQFTVVRIPTLGTRYIEL